MRHCIAGAFVCVATFGRWTTTTSAFSPRTGSSTTASSSRQRGPRTAVSLLRGPTRLRAASGAAPEASTSASSLSCDVLVLGSGPAACAIAALLGRQELDVILADQNVDRPWVPNYGAWKDEWEAVLARYRSGGVQIDGGNCGSGLDREWAVTDCFFGGSFDKPVDERMRLDRPYVRLDRFAIKESFVNSNAFKIIKANHQSKAIGVNVYSPAGSLVHDAEGTTTKLVTHEGDTTSVRSKLVVDCTGHESQLVLKDSREPYRPPGFQIAYGILVDVAETDPSSPMIGPYDKKAMTLFDYRTDHFGGDAAWNSKAEAAPTFMYAMPLQGNQVFFEETSLVARPALSFQECKDRCMERLDFHGIKVLKTYEEEFCYIPMGGALPMKDQRVVAVGGSAAMVHPSTGFHACRCLMGATDVAAAIAAELKLPQPNLDRAAASAYHALWSPSNIRQRNFAVFGGEFLMKQNVVGLRGFFDGFFRLPLAQWAGFLAGWPGLPNNDRHETWLARILYGVNFLVRLPPSVALDMVSSIVAYSLQEGTPLLQSVTPFFGEPSGYEYKRNNDRVGDVAAKLEARRMIQESTVTEDLPVSFDDESTVAEAATVTLPPPQSSIPVESFQ